MRRFISILRDKRGFTLVEIIVSIGILAVVSLFVLEMFLRSMNTEKRASDYDNASSYCQTVLEYYKTYGTCDPAVSDLDICGNWSFSDEEDGSFVMYMHFDKNWKPVPAYDYEGYTVTALADAPGEENRGIQTVSAEAVRHKPMVMEDKAEEILMRVSASKYFPITERR